MNTIEKDISQRIAMLRFLMIFGIVILHTPLYIPLAETGGSLFDFIKAFFQHAVFRTSVPVLTCISGYLLFKGPLPNQFLQLFRKKTKTIFIPLFIFNFPIVLIVYSIQYTQAIDYQFSVQLTPLNPMLWMNAIFGLTTSPINYPLNFLRDLYVVSLLSPLFLLLLKTIPKTGLVIVSLFFLFNYDGFFIIRNLMPIMFYFGAYLALYDIDMRQLDKYAIHLLLLFIVLCIAIIHFKIENRNFLRLISPFLIWPAATLIVDTWLGKRFIALAKYSFPIFLMQGPILLVCWLVYNQYLPMFPYWSFWIATPFISALILVNFYRIGCFIMPRTMRFVFGGH